jgi:hypothetical protein
VLADALSPLRIKLPDQVAGKAHENVPVLDGGITFIWLRAVYAAVAAHAIKVQRVMQDMEVE